MNVITYRFTDNRDKKNINMTTSIHNGMKCMHLFQDKMQTVAVVILKLMKSLARS